MSNASRPPAGRLVTAIFLLCLVAAVIFNVLAALPFWRIHFGEAPPPGTAPRYVGQVMVVGDLVWVGKGWRPPKYFIKTTDKTVEFRCGFWPTYTTCPFGYTPREGEIFEIGIDPFWGVDYIKFPKVRGFIDIWSGYQMELFRKKQARGGFYNLFFAVALGIYAMFVFRRLFIAKARA